MKFLEKMSDVAGKYFALWVVVVACIAFFIPKPFLIFNGYITLLLGIVMFGMGLTLKGADFKLIVTNPIPVMIGILAQFVVMPLAALDRKSTRLNSSHVSI